MYIISELHNQYSGDISLAQQMILQSKMAGANAVKVQLYDAEKFYGNRQRQYLSLSFDEVRRLKEYADRLQIDFFASFFDEERLEWCLKLDFPVLKIASVVLEKYPELCQKAVKSGKRTLISLGRYDWKTKPLPFNAPNVEYLYCVAKYPTLLEELEMPDFHNSFFTGYSDHTIGIHACLYAIARGAQVLEKHFTLSPSLHKDTERGHACGMTFADLEQIRVFAEAVRVIERKGPAFEKLEERK